MFPIPDNMTLNLSTSTALTILISTKPYASAGWASLPAVANTAGGQPARGTYA